jgi:hypothetical protein
MMVGLYVPKEFAVLSKDERVGICNGCGAKGGLSALFVPNSIYGLDVSICCDIHDFMYEHGTTLEDKEKADRVFRNNLFRVIEAHTKNWFLKRLRLRRAKTYYYFVKEWGGSAFWKNSNKLEDFDI